MTLVTVPLMPERLNLRYARVSGEVVFFSTADVPKFVLGRSLCTYPSALARIVAEVGPVAAVFVRLKLAAGLTPATLAETANAPGVAFAVNCGAVATPFAPVNAVTVAPLPANTPLAPLAGAVNVTLTPATGCAAASVTLAASATPYAALTCALCGVLPATTATAAGTATAAVFVRLKLAAALTPLTLAETANAPAVAFAVNCGAVATPVAAVVAVTVRTPPTKTPPAPLAGAVNVTLTPATGCAEESVTLAASATPIGRIDPRALCGELPQPQQPPPPAPPQRTFARLKFAAGLTPATLAETANAPGVAFAVNCGAVATPFAPVNAVTVAPLPANTPLAPLAGAVNVTLTPATGCAEASVTLAASATP